MNAEKQSRVADVPKHQYITYLLNPNWNFVRVVVMSVYRQLNIMIDLGKTTLVDVRKNIVKKMMIFFSNNNWEKK